MSFLLDTVVISELRKNDRADREVKQWQKKIQGADTWLSVITIQEIYVGILRVAPKDPVFAARLNVWLDETVIPHFSDHLLDIDLAVAEVAAKMRVLYGLSFNDALIAATAEVHELTLATRNVSDFEHTGINVVNPWEL